MRAALWQDYVECWAAVVCRWRWCRPSCCWAAWRAPSRSCSAGEWWTSRPAQWCRTRRMRPRPWADSRRTPLGAARASAAAPCSHAARAASAAETQPLASTGDTRLTRWAARRAWDARSHSRDASRTPIEHTTTSFICTSSNHRFCLPHCRTRRYWLVGC